MSRDQAAHTRFFLRIRPDVDTGGVIRELDADRTIWLSQTGRQQRAPAQVETQVVPLRGLRRSCIRGLRRRDVQESRYTRLAKRLPETVALLERLAAEIGGELGRARIARLPAGGKVLPHVDRGDYYRVRDRYHLVLRSPIGSLLRSGGEQARLQERELWWFDNHALHDACNDGPEERLHLIFDVLAREPRPSALRRAAPAATVELAQLLSPTDSGSSCSELDEIVRAVEIYRAACRQPSEWHRVLQQRGLETQADAHPIAALARLMWPDLHGAPKRRRESAIAWSLAQLDLDRHDLRTLPDALRSAGGLEAVDRAWHEDRDRNLYAPEPLSEAFSAQR